MATPAPALCDVKLRFSKIMLDAAAAILALQNQHTSNLISGGNGLANFSAILEAARIEWENARQAYMFHLSEHGC